MFFKICIEGELDAMTQVNGSFTVTVAPGTPPPPVLTMTPPGGNLPGETQGTADGPPGDVVCTVSGGQGPYQFAVTAGSLPPGMQLFSTTNADGSETITIAGTPTQSGAFSFTLTVTDAAANTASLKATVSPKKVG
jgi:large repetitive protein